MSITTGTAGQRWAGDRFREAIAGIRPAPDELRWQEIPWQTDLRDACRLAADTGKPIFLWAMNGNPLGCT